MIIYDINPPRKIRRTVGRTKRKPAVLENPKPGFNIFHKIFALILIFSLAGFLSLFPPAKVFAATGDITAVRIASDTAYSGWTAEIDIDGLSTGGTYDFGLGANNDPTNAKMVFTVTSQGYDDSGNATTMTRTVYGTNYVRKVYPDNAQAYETNNGGSVTVRVALSDYIYSSDTVTVSIASGFYTQGSASNSVSGLSVTNNSAEAYPKVIANWSWPGYDRITGSTFKLRAVAFHRSAKEGRPVRAVKYTCTDQHSNTATDTVASPSIDGTISDAVPVVEYVGTISTASLTQGDTLTCNFQAYPWYGDPNSVLNTDDGVNTMPTPLYAPQYYLLDKDNTYGVTVAVVDPVAGDNATGAAVDYASFDSQNPPAAFLNIYAAANAIAAYNNTNHSRNNTGAGIIYLKEGSHVWTGGTVTAGGQASAPSWTTVTKFPGTARANVLISSASGTKQVGERLKLNDVKITNSTTIGFTGMDTIWVHNSDINSTGAGTFYTNTVNYFTDSVFYNGSELSPYSTQNASRAIIRGNNSGATLSSGVRAYTIIGNNFDLSGSAGISDTVLTTPPVSNAIYAFNILSQFSATLPLIGHLNSSLSNATGTAIVQNILERVSNSAPPLMQISADQSTSNPVNNILIWNNTLIGQRLNIAYNDYNLNDVGPAYRKGWSVKNNIFDSYNVVTDKDSHGSTPDNDRYGNHSIVHGVGFRSNISLERTGAGYTNKFDGLNSIKGSSLNPQYVDDNSILGDGTGNGDYHLTASSPALNLVASSSALLLYDIAGNLRHSNGYGAVGAYEWDVTAPSVTSFTIPATASSLTVDITTFTASDAVGVTGYKLTESSTAPAWDASGWSGSAPSTYTFSSAGSKTLYAWAKDAVGNVSTSANDTVTITLPTYTIGGTVSGLTGTVVLQNNAGDDESVSSNGSFTFDTSLSDGAAYTVTVLTQPSGQTCTATNGSGTVASANVTNVSVTCTNDDSTPPVRSAGSPSGGQSAGTTQVTLSLTTDENATCKYSTSAGTAYGSMTDTFSTTGGTSHSSTISGLSNGNSYNYYVRCTDGSNANSDDYTISFSVASPASSGGGGGGSPAMWTLPTAPTGGFKMSINNGASTTSNRNVILNFNAGTDIKKMAISMTGDFTDATQEDYVASRQWDLCSKLGGTVKNLTCPDGTYTLYAKFYTAYGRSSSNAIASSTITLKTGATMGENLHQTTNLPFTNPLTKNLQYRQTDADIKRLQIFLNSNPDTRLANSGVGSPGKETNYFGPLTLKAVIKFQEKYASDVLSPWGLIKGTGYIGKTTLAKINELISKIISQ